MLLQSESVGPVSMVVLGGFADVVFEFAFGGSTARILETLAGARELVEARGIPLYDAGQYGVLVYCHLASGQQRQGQGALERMAEVLDCERQWDVGFYCEMRAWDGGPRPFAAIRQWTRATSSRIGAFHARTRAGSIRAAERPPAAADAHAVRPGAPALGAAAVEALAARLARTCPAPFLPDDPADSSAATAPVSNGATSVLSATFRS